MKPQDDCLSKPEDFALRGEFVGRCFATAAALPVSYRLGGAQCRGMGAFACGAKHARVDANIRTVTYAGSKDGLEFSVACTLYDDFPVLEWTACFTNRSQSRSAVIGDFSALDADLGAGPFSLWHCTGDYYSIDGYRPIEEPIGEGGIDISSNGRACDGAFPYFRILSASSTVSLAVGWPGRWKASFQSGRGQTRVKAGQNTFSACLEPGETARSPLIALMFTSGGQERAMQVWRRFYAAHVLPHPGGRPLQPRLACASNEDGEEFTQSTEVLQLDSLERCLSHGFRPDVWWIDAGWYRNGIMDGKPNWWMTGTWHVDGNRFPRGLMPVSKAAQAAGADLLVWFEPERVYEGSELDRLHPEWLLKPRDPNEKSRLLNLGDGACRQWLTDHVCMLIKENGIRIYRQDFNFDPLACWRDNEPQDRQGMLENLHVQGYLHYWDDLLERNPGLWIDSCASGGRRNDLETMKRAVPLHYTDYGYGELPVKTAFHRTMFEWIPYFKEAVVSWDRNAQGANARYEQAVDPFSFHCALASMLFPVYDQRTDLPYETAVKYVGIWRRAAEFMLDDFHPLTPWSRSGADWVAWQFDSRGRDAGWVQALRHAQCEPDKWTVRLKNLDASALYRLEDAETGECFEKSGGELMDAGVAFALPRRAGRILFYSRL